MKHNSLQHKAKHTFVFSCLLFCTLFFFGLSTSNAKAQAFRTTWITTDGTITIPTTGGGYNYNITWTNLTNAGIGDGSTTGAVGNYQITGLANGDTYEIAITGAFPHFYMNIGAERLKLQTIEEWGTQAWTSMEKAFYGCSNLTYNATDIPNLSNVSNMSYMFRGATLFNGNIGNWNTTTVTDMSFMFNGAAAFNQNIGTWNTAAVTDMNRMFYNATSFNQNIGTWTTAAVTDMSYMFGGATSFNQNIGSWNTAAVTNMTNMFSGATSFNGNIANWNTAAVTNMSVMFSGATSFNQNIATWNTGAVTNMASMFFNATSFNQNIGGWTTGTVASMAFMFSGATSFNQNIGGWNISNLNSGFFTGAYQMLDNSGLNIANYDATLIAWAAQNVASGVNLGAQGLEYCAGEAARNSLIADDSWDIIGDMLDCDPEINVQGNGNDIADGAAGTSPTNDTDFGDIAECGTNTISKTYTIQNIGGAVLDITGIALSGTNAGDFTLSGLPAFPTTVAPTTGTQTFTVTFDPSGTGNRTALVTINNNDTDENPYTFVINGNGTADTTNPVIPTLADINSQCSSTPVAPTTTDNCAGTITGTTGTAFPITTTTLVTWTFTDSNGNSVTADQNVIINDGKEINILGNAISIVDGDATPDVADDTNFGNTTSRTITYTIENTGTEILTISSIISSGTNSADFVVSNVPASVTAGGTATFDVTFTPLAVGTRTATITINNNDCDEDVYDFAVEGSNISSGDVLLVRTNTYYPTIQEGVDASIDGDVLVMTVDRVYPENVLVGKTLTFQSNAAIYQNVSIDQIEMNGLGKTLTIDGNMCLTELLNMEEGDVIVTASANFALRSTASGTAMVINDDDNNTVQGNVIAERYLGSVSDLAGGYDAQGYHMFSSPFSDATISQFGDDMSLVLNTAFNGAVEPTYTRPFPTFYEYDETSAGTPSPSGIYNAFTIGYKVPTTVNLKVGKGYEANIATGTTVDMNGTLNNGDIPISITHQGLAYANQGFNLIGNPYPSPISWTEILAQTNANTLVKDAVYIDIPTSQYGATYATFINSVPVNGGKSDIAPFQGFFVQAKATGNLIMNNDIRPDAYQDSRFYKMTGGNAKGAKEGLIKLAIEQDGKLDETAIYFERGATSKFDGKFDALKIHKINGTTPTLYSYNEDIEESGIDTYFSINGLNEFNEDMTLPLAMNIVKSGKHKIVVREIKYFHSLSNIYLYDSLTETLHDLKANPEYEFVASASKEVKRFVVLFKTNKVFSEKGHIVAYPNPTPNNFSYSLKNDSEGMQTVRLFDATGKLILERVENKQGAFLEGVINLEKQASGLYLLQISDSRNTTNARIIKE